LINYGITRWGNKDEVMLLRETDRVLSPLFLGLLARAVERRRVLLIFDAIELDEKDDWAIASRGEIYKSLKRYEEALLDFNRAIELDENFALVIILRGATYQLMERYEEALQDFNRAIEFDEEVITIRGETYRLMGRYEDALADSLRAVELNAKEVDAHLSLIACYRKLGRMDEHHRQIEIARGLFERASAYDRACFAAVCGDEESALASIPVNEPGRSVLALLQLGCGKVWGCHTLAALVSTQIMSNSKSHRREPVDRSSPTYRIQERFPESHRREPVDCSGPTFVPSLGAQAGLEHSTGSRRWDSGVLSSSGRLGLNDPPAPAGGIHKA